MRALSTMRTSWMLAGLMVAPAAVAQPLTGVVIWEASNDGGASWHNYLPHVPGQPYKVRATAAWTDGATPTIGLAAASLEQIDLVGAGAGDTFDTAGAYSLQPLAPEVWTVQPGTGSSTGFLKIDNVDPVRRVIFGQLPKILPGGLPNPDFDAANPIRLFEMDAVAAPDPGGRIITIQAVWSRFGTPLRNQLAIFTTEQGTSMRPVEEATQIPVVIDTIIPAPGAGVLMAAAGAGCAVRRRRG